MWLAIGGFGWGGTLLLLLVYWRGGSRRRRLGEEEKERGMEGNYMEYGKERNGRKVKTDDRERNERLPR